MFLLQLLKMVKIQEFFKTGYHTLKKCGILQNGDHGMTVTVIFSGEDGKKAENSIRVNYSLGRLASAPTIRDMDIGTWTVSE